MKTKLLFYLILLLGLNARAQIINVSTGVDNSGAALATGANDPNWQIVSHPTPKVCGYHPVWETNPVSVTNAGWINDSGSYFASVPAIYTFERSFTVLPGTTNLNYTLSVACDDALVSLELVRPDLVTFPLTVSPTTPYHLSLPISNTVSSPMAGLWKIRAVANFIDTTAGFLFSGKVTISPAATNCGNTFIKEINPLDTEKPNIFKIPNGDFYTTSSLFPNIIINRFDANGTPIWTKSLNFGLTDPTLTLTDLIVDSSDSQIVGLLNCTTGTIVFKYDESTNTFTWINRTGNNKAFNIHETGSVNYIVTGSDAASTIQIFEINQATGAAGGYQKNGMTGEFYSTYDSGNVYGSCRYYADSGSQFFPSLYKYDATGTNLWTKTYVRDTPTARIYPVAPIVDGSSLVELSTGDDNGFNLVSSGTGQIWLVKTDLNGTLTWTKTIAVTGYTALDGVKIINASDGYYLLLNHFATPIQKNLFFVIKTDKNGEVLWANRYGLPTTENYVTGGYEKGGFLYLTGMSTTYSAISHMILLKLNASGKTDAACPFVNSVNAVSSIYANVETSRPTVNATTSFTATAMSGTNASLAYTEAVQCSLPCVALTQIQSSQCGSALPTLATTILANWVTGATEYRFKITKIDPITNLPIATPLFKDRPINNIALCNVPGVIYDAKYQIEIDVKIGGVWQNTYGPACTVTTPNPVSTIGAQCGTTLTAMNQWIVTTMIPYINTYRFRVTQLDGALLPVGIPQITDQPANKFNMTQLTGILYGTTYRVEVALKNLDGTFLPYNTACNITTPPYPTTQLQASYCAGFAVANGTQFIYANVVSGAAQYRFRLFDGITYTTPFDNTANRFKLNDFVGLLPSTTYTVEVAVKMPTEPAFGPYGSSCTIITPAVFRTTPTAAIEFKAVAYPNPFATGFYIDVKTASNTLIEVKVYDMLGRLLENQSIDNKELSVNEIGAAYPTGIYNIVVTQDDNQKTLRVIKK